MAGRSPDIVSSVWLASFFMAKFRVEKELEDGWCRWVPPIMTGYRMACCDCGLVHDMEFKAVRVTRQRRDGSWEYRDLPVKSFRVMMRAKRNNRSTAALRRGKANVEMSPGRSEQ